MLRLADLDEIGHLAKVSKDSVLPEEGAEWMGPWTQIASPEYERSLVQYYLASIANWKADKWNLELAVFLKASGDLIGNVGIYTANFPINKTAKIGFFMLKNWQRQGFGSEAVRGSLQFVFADLGADRVRSQSHSDNKASQKLHLGLGFKKDGTGEIENQPGSTGPRFLLNHSDWNKQDDVLVSGFRECQNFFNNSSKEQ